LYTIQLLKLEHEISLLQHLVIATGHYHQDAYYWNCIIHVIINLLACPSYGVHSISYSDDSGYSGYNGLWTILIIQAVFILTIYICLIGIVILASWMVTQFGFYETFLII
jgi:hypothetical protein